MVQMAIETVAGGEVRTEIETLRAEVARKIAAHVPVEGPKDTAVPGLRLSRRSAPSECYSAAYEPELVVCVQGEKRIIVGGTTHICDASTFLLTTVDLPVVGQITKASPDEPFLAMVLKLEMPVVREILSQEEFHMPEAVTGVRGMAVGKTPGRVARRLFPIARSARCAAGYSISRQPDAARNLLSSAALAAGQASARHRHAGRAEQPHGQGGRLAEGELHQAAARGGTRVGRADGRLHAAPSFPLADRDESAAISEAAATARGARCAC